MLLTISAVLLVLPWLLWKAGVPTPVCLLALALAPLVSIFGYEHHGHRHVDASLARMRARLASRGR